MISSPKHILLQHQVIVWTSRRATGLRGSSNITLTSWIRYTLRSLNSLFKAISNSLFEYPFWLFSPQTSFQNTYKVTPNNRNRPQNWPVQIFWTSRWVVCSSTQVYTFVCYSFSMVFTPFRCYTFLNWRFATSKSSPACQKTGYRVPQPVSDLKSESVPISCLILCSLAETTTSSNMSFGVI